MALISSRDKTTGKSSLFGGPEKFACWSGRLRYNVLPDDLSPLIFTRDELENSPFRSSPIVKAITEEGLRI